MAFKRITTQYCLRKQQECLYSEKSFDIATVALGTGSYESISDNIKSLKNEILRLPVNKLVQNGAQWTFKIYITEVQENTYFKEIGVFDNKGNLLYYSECDFVMTSSVEGIPCQTAFTGVFELMQGLNAIVIDPSTEIASTNFVELNYQKLEEKGQANGYASLDSEGKVPEYQLPEINNGTSLPLGSTIILDRVLSYEESQGLALQGTYVYKEAVAGSRYGYPDFYQKCVDEKNAGTPTQTTLGESTITTYNNANGHIFYNIADKAVVDAFFNSTGIADMYGVDEENERIFLPRNSWFMQLTTDISKVNDYNKPGLPNHTHSIPAARSSAGSIPFGGGGGNMGFVYETGEVENSDIYGASDTVQPPSSNKLLYYVVGNTVQEEAITNVIDITTSENDTIPLGFSTYQNGAQPSAAWLKSQGQWNSGTIYAAFYNLYASKIGQAFCAGYVVDSAYDYTDYDLVINTTEQTFRLPLKNGDEIYIDYASREELAFVNPYTVETDGYYYLAIDKRAVNTTARIEVNGNIVLESNYTNQYSSNDTILKLIKGDVITWVDGVSGHIAYFKAVGNGSLYFKVANAVQNLELLDAAEVTEALADKLNISQVKAYITEVYQSGTSWYRIWSDGWCEQGGDIPPTQLTAGVKFTVSLLKPFKDINYRTYISMYSGDSTSQILFRNAYPGSQPTTSSFTYFGAGVTRAYWFAQGYIY